MKKLLSIVMLVCILASMCTVSAWADTGTAVVNGTEYSSMQDAINAAAGGGEVKLLTNFILTAPVTNTGSVTIDLNGQKMSYSNADCGVAMITNSGSLTIKDSVGGGIISYQYTGSDAGFSGNVGNYTILNSGALTVTGGTIENLTTLNGDGTVGHMYDAIDSTGSLAIYGGKISCPTYRSVRIRTSGGGCDVLIAGGEFEGQVWIQAPNANEQNLKLSITGGSFSPRGVDGSSVFFGSVDGGTQNYDVSISGGYFATKIGSGSGINYSGSLITGGTFANEGALNNTAAALIPSGYEPKQNADGSYTVIDPNAPTPVNPSAPAATPAPVQNVYYIPATSDNSNMALWSILALALLSTAFVTRKRKAEN